MHNNVLLEIKELTKHFPIRKGIIFSKQVGSVQAVDRVSFSIKKGETLGLVGESGCGKTTIGKLILRLIEPTSGTIIFNGDNILDYSKGEMRSIRKSIQMIFQDPYESLNPKMNIEEILSEPLEVHRIFRNRAEKTERIMELLEVVGLKPYHMGRYPHEFSGGQRQRVGIARALALNPQLIICDEPVSALDVSIQAQIINLLQDLQEEFGFSYLFISHDLSVVKHISNRVAVMYLGKIVELAGKDELYENPLHPYTEALFSAIPIPDPFFKKNQLVLEGDVPSPINPPIGCRFNTRCRYAKEICRTEEAPLIDMGEGHLVACHMTNDQLKVEQ